MSSSVWLRNGLSSVFLGFVLGPFPSAGGNGLTASQLTISVLDPKGRPVPEVVVVAIPKNADAAVKVRPAKAAVMDQLDRQFVPHILAVETGAPVTFPNSDSVSHQVYSFSPAKRFQLPLYRGHTHPPLVFDKPGVVVLGCNIHDDMIGYIYVAPSPYFAITNPEGRVTFNELPGQSYEVTVWSPRFREPLVSRQVKLGSYGGNALEVRLTQPLRAEPRRVLNEDY